MYKKIGDYGIVGNLHSIALIAKDGSIDWLCWPTISSPSIFGAILDAEKGGSFSIAPSEDWDSNLTYLEDSNVLCGKFRTTTGVCSLIDFMPVEEEAKADGTEHLLIRIIRIERGKMRLKVSFKPRFDYGRALPTYKQFPGKGVLASGNGEHLWLATTGALKVSGNDVEGIWDLSEGERMVITLRYGATETEILPKEDAEKLLTQTLKYWRAWVYRSGPGFFNDLGAHRRQVVRSLLVLKLLCSVRYGTMAAAATTSIPEEIGGVRNWDYRYSWVRDTCMALNSLYHVGYEVEMEGYLKWLNEIIHKSKKEELQIMYRLDRLRDIEEADLTHLSGYRGSRPVRVGNAAVNQRQWSIYGDVLLAAYLLATQRKKIEREMWHGLRLMCNYLLNHWRKKDWSIWEMRKPPQHYVYSKVMSWAALHHGLAIAGLTGLTADLEKWKQARDEIRQEVLTKGWNESRQSFVLHYDSDALDASMLLLPMVGFLPFDDPRILSTVDAIRIDLSNEGFIYRYLTDDGLPGRDATFLACTLWLIVNLARQGEIDEAELLVTMIDEMAKPLHLMAEEYDPIWQEQLGNFPQAFSHESYITAVMTIAEASAEFRNNSKTELNLLVDRHHPQPFSVPAQVQPEDLADFLSHVVEKYSDDGRPDYEALAGSPVTERLKALLVQLRDFETANLKTRSEKISFWGNLFNIAVMHGVLSMEIKLSIKEVSWFFRRIGCRIRGRKFDAETILNAILRGNRPAPGRLLPPLAAGDPRLLFSIRPADPRVLFALSLATVSSPPIFVLRPETLNEDLEKAAKKYLVENAELNLDKKTLLLPRLIKWYDDFGKTGHDKAVFVAGVENGKKGKAILEHPDAFQLEYQEYDWRLNRSTTGRSKVGRKKL